MAPDETRIRGWPMRLAVSLVVGAIPPASVWIYSYVDHWVSYNGTCGPHAPDISAHPCDFQTYMNEWAAGFAGVGLFMTTLAVVPVGLAVGGACFHWLGSSNEGDSDD